MDILRKNLNVFVVAGLAVFAFFTFLANGYAEPFLRYQKFVPGEPYVTIADIDDNGSNDVIVAVQDSNTIYAWDSDSLPLITANANGEFASLDGSVSRCTPAVGDLDLDHNLEVVVAEYSSMNGYVYAFDVDSSGNAVTLWRYQGWKNTESGFASISTSPVIANIDDDPELEVIVASENGDIFVINHLGEENDGIADGTPFASTGGYAIKASPAVGDLDGDGSPEIVAVDVGGNVHVWNNDGTSFIEGLTVFATTNYGKELASSGLLLMGGPDEPTAHTYSSPVLADLDGDGDLEIILASDENGEHGRIYAWHHVDLDDNGSPDVVEGWTDDSGNAGIPLSGPAIGTVAVGNLYDEIEGEIPKKLEVVVADNDVLYVFSHDGTGVARTINLGENGDIESSPVIGDLFNDPSENLQIIIGTKTTVPNNYGLRAYKLSTDRTELIRINWTTDNNKSIGFSSPVITDLPDSLAQLVVGTEDGTVQVWTMDAAYNPDKIEWASFRANSANTGTYSDQNIIFEEDFDDIDIDDLRHIGQPWIYNSIWNNFDEASTTADGRATFNSLEKVYPFDPDDPNNWFHTRGTAYRVDGISLRKNYRKDDNLAFLAKGISFIRHNEDGTDNLRLRPGFSVVLSEGGSLDDNTHLRKIWVTTPDSRDIWFDDDNDCADYYNKFDLLPYQYPNDPADDGTEDDLAYCQQIVDGKERWQWSETGWFYIYFQSIDGAVNEYDRIQIYDFSSDVETTEYSVLFKWFGKDPDPNNWKMEVYFYKTAEGLSPSASPNFVWESGNPDVDPGDWGDPRYGWKFAPGGAWQGYGTTLMDAVKIYGPLDAEITDQPWPKIQDFGSWGNEVLAANPNVEFDGVAIHLDPFDDSTLNDSITMDVPMANCSELDDCDNSGNLDYKYAYCQWVPDATISWPFPGSPQTFKLAPDTSIRNYRSFRVIVSNEYGNADLVRFTFRTPIPSYDIPKYKIPMLSDGDSTLGGKLISR